MTESDLASPTGFEELIDGLAERTPVINHMGASSDLAADPLGAIFFGAQRYSVKPWGLDGLVVSVISSDKSFQNLWPVIS